MTFARAWSVIGLKDYFIQQDFHHLVAPEARLKLIEIRQTSSISEPNVKQRKVFVIRDSGQNLKITKSIAGQEHFTRKMINHTFKGFFSLTTSSPVETDKKGLILSSVGEYHVMVLLQSLLFIRS